MEQQKTRSASDLTQRDILAALDALGARNVQQDTLAFEGERFVIPASMNVRGAIEWLEEWEETQETTFSFSRTYPYRPYDGAAAMERAFVRVFGVAGMGRAIKTLFGSTPPEYVSVATGVNTTVQVPWGQIQMPALDATIYTGATRSREDGIVFEITVQAPRKHRQRIEGFLDVVADELAQRSIYRGKAITGGEEPTFLDLSTIDPSRIVYSADTLTQLNANLWSLIEHSDTMRTLGIPLKRAVLAYGPWGTGKTLAGALTGQRATANGWTYILARPGRDDLMSTMTTARLYAPSVVWFEDIDVSASDATAQYISRLLDALDGVSAKGREVIVGFTTNHVERIAKGMLRPGRIDSVVHFGTLAPEDVEKLVRISVPDHILAPSVDWARVGTAFEGYVPAFAREAIDRAMRYTIARTGAVGQVTTDDLVSAAQGLRAQLALMDEAGLGVREDSMSEAFRKLIGEAVADTMSVSECHHSHAPFTVDDNELREILSAPHEYAKDGNE